jgi:hypothetical protein
MITRPCASSVTVDVRPMGEVVVSVRRLRWYSLEKSRPPTSTSSSHSSRVSGLSISVTRLLRVGLVTSDLPDGNVTVTSVGSMLCAPNDTSGAMATLILVPSPDVASDALGDSVQLP